ncbi:C-type lectin domain family 4 member G isoform X1 [Peromyscus leucopus]|uniref:C-type lectin domain family 4 member G isoform X1 n=1 Tax=Peromyscus leucopus TaxID=10041 RepID=UPI0010A1AD18|nr:C-type lectin domain family 4 member G isoform X1 [Peromyscus leucopus]XP_028713205.1 C-type lectin domain family 4 member G isoform X1 [Peromyscus leucopus]
MDTGGYSKLDTAVEEVPRAGTLGALQTKAFLPGLGFPGGHSAMGSHSEHPIVQGLQRAQDAAQPPGPAEDKRCVRSCRARRLRPLAVGASEQKMMLSTLKEDVGACRNCCSGIKAQLQATLAEFKDTQAKLMEQESTLKELQERVTQGLAKAGRDREDIRSELLQALEAVKQQNRSCEQCPTSWLYFQGSCYYFSETQAIWSTAQSYCSVHGAHLAIVKGPDEQGFLSQHTHGRGYWLGLKAVRHLGKIRSYQWVDGVSLTFSHWNSGEPNDSRGHEDCIMMLHSGLWNDAPCTNERDGWICEKRSSC